MKKLIKKPVVKKSIRKAKEIIKEEELKNEMPLEAEPIEPTKPVEPVEEVGNIQTTEHTKVMTISVNGKEVTRLNDGQDTEYEYHCRVSDGTTAHYKKNLFK
jgi:hypothetical protein